MKFGSNVIKTALTDNCFEFEIYLSGFAIFFFSTAKVGYRTNVRCHDIRTKQINKQEAFRERRHLHDFDHMSILKMTQKDINYQSSLIYYSS